MEKDKVVVALGRSAFGNTLPEQKKKVSLAAKAIADLVAENYEVIITHSNGPQVGMIQTALTEFSRIDPEFTAAPMSVCSAMSQGYIGYDLQNAIRTELLNRGIFKPVSTIITQVKVDPFDPAFDAPTKVIGRFMTKNEAEIEEHKGNYVVYEESNAGKGYRRIIASPYPIDIYEIDAVKALVDAGQIVIAAGGGGIPVLEQGTVLKGASAIIEKDYTAAKLADMLNASTLLFLTSAQKLSIEDESGAKKELGLLSSSDAAELVDKGYFNKTTTLPKVQSALNFVQAGEGRRAVITSLENAKDGMHERTGTIIC
ncbi:carbamate kinase [Parasporobacterium paucivorans]|uniref:Carbamate kinase n=1 Tax=Parasporobacterium paucivorans DSM 15970 TaxID=1122934 RepID=A0A1M6EQT0_9FIRM|nr:carbamate kinase [Parasporobacterium paucivorans]SHI87669.1 carbamate kinase [Parasporobacterium paucivorans DSM 15970]